MTTPPIECTECGYQAQVEVDVCPSCGHGLSVEQKSDLVKVFVAENPVQANLVRSILEGVRIPVYIPSEFVRILAFDPEVMDLSKGVALEIPSSTVERANEVLCAAGVVCRAEPGEVDAVWREHVAPAVAKAEEGAPDVVAVLDLNNMAVTEQIASRLGEVDRRFLEQVFLEACRQDKPRLAAALARTLDAHDDDDLAERVTAIPDGPTRAVAATALAHLKGHTEAAIRSLVWLLEDDAEAVRDAAIEGLFSLVGEDFGFEPDAPVEERNDAVQRWKDRVGPDPAGP